MRAIKMLVAALVIVVLAGCGSKNDKMREFLHRYGNATIETAYKSSGASIINHSFNDLNLEIEKLNIKSSKDKEINGETFHFVKAKMVYKINSKLPGKKLNEEFVRWMALAIKEDGFGNMVVILSKSEEYFAMGKDEKDMSVFYRDELRNGENLIK